VFGQKKLSVFFHLPYSIFCQILKSTDQGVLNKESTAGLDGAEPGEYYIQLTFLRNAPAQLCVIPISKNTFTSIEN